MIDLAELCHANIVALNERHRARVAGIMERQRKELDRASEDFAAELAEISFGSQVAMDKRLEGFRGLAGTAASESAKEPPADRADEAKATIVIAAPRPAPRLAELLNDEGPHKPLPRVLERPVREHAGDVR